MVVISQQVHHVVHMPPLVAWLTKWWVYRQAPTQLGCFLAEPDNASDSSHCRVLTTVWATGMPTVSLMA
jgi:hypothetical protein